MMMTTTIIVMMTMTMTMLIMMMMMMMMMICEFRMSSIADKSVREECLHQTDSHRRTLPANSATQPRMPLSPSTTTTTTIRKGIIAGYFCFPLLMIYLENTLAQGRSQKEIGTEVGISRVLHFCLIFNAYLFFYNIDGFIWGLNPEAPPKYAHALACNIYVI